MTSTKTIRLVLRIIVGWVERSVTQRKMLGSTLVPRGHAARYSVACVRLRYTQPTQLIFELNTKRIVYKNRYK